MKKAEKAVKKAAQQVANVVNKATADTKEAYEHQRLREQTDTHVNNAENAKKQTESYLEELNKFSNDDEKNFKDAEEAYNQTLTFATGDECKDALNKAKAQLDTARAHLQSIKEAGTKEGADIKIQIEIATKAKTDIDAIRDQYPTEAGRAQLVEQATNFATKAQQAATSANQLLETAKKKKTDLKPAFDHAIDQLKFHIKHAEMQQKEIVAPRLNREAEQKKQQENIVALQSGKQTDKLAEEAQQISDALYQSFSQGGVVWDQPETLNRTALHIQRMDLAKALDQVQAKTLVSNTLQKFRGEKLGLNVEPISEAQWQSIYNTIGIKPSVTNTAPITVPHILSEAEKDALNEQSKQLANTLYISFKSAGYVWSQHETFDKTLNLIKSLGLAKSLDSFEKFETLVNRTLFNFRHGTLGVPVEPLSGQEMEELNSSFNSLNIQQPSQTEAPTGNVILFQQQAHNSAANVGNNTTPAPVNDTATIKPQ